MRDLDIGSVVVNVNGGAIAMGHPPASSTSTYQPEKAAQQDPLLDVPLGGASRRLAGHSPLIEAVHRYGYPPDVQESATRLSFGKPS
jgi:hypothetical protein